REARRRRWIVKQLLSLKVNGVRRTFAVRPSATLLEVLREETGLTGTKRGCDHGDCGACTVLVDGEPRLACITLALAVRGRRIDTVEGIARGQDLHPLQDAFDRLGAVQCGFCTPAMLLSAGALLNENPEPSREEIRHALAGNLCRCTGYQKIVDAVAAAAGGER
ncbi:MAG: (2Fe-2S)-binding protein, partial [Planctomycetota bacterium]